MMEKYRLRCPLCTALYTDAYTQSCPAGHTSLLRTEYAARQLQVRTRLPGMFRFSDWLPVEGTLGGAGGPVCFQSEAFSREVRRKNLHFCFSGYWPERGGSVLTCSFKELEAFPTVLRVRERGRGVLVVASAGNTGRAFLQVSALTGTPVVVVVPESALGRLWSTQPAPHTFLVAIRGDYTDAIRFSQQICALPSFLAEGGARNVARRDGMGTVVLEGATAIGRIPTEYFQAIGSGTGGIAAWEAAMRLCGDGRFGTALPRLHMSQNIPFIPMVSAWREHRRELVPEKDMPDARAAIAAVSADVLTNRDPPYSLPGGVFDALSATRGEMYAVTNDAARRAGRLFTELEGVDLDPAAAVCLASFLAALEEGKIPAQNTVLVNLTGGGYERVKEDLPLCMAEPQARLPAGAGIGSIDKDLRAWVRSYA